ncbi:hypothetical protein PLESTM_000976000 [Pleodorina starrii]|nr:hypothetical protein PLESTM_000976000 [Pleodorina starrii]
MAHTYNIHNANRLLAYIPLLVCVAVCGSSGPQGARYIHAYPPSTVLSGPLFNDRLYVITSMFCFRPRYARMDDIHRCTRAHTVSGCPSGWSAAVGTIFDSWPKPGTVECVDYSGCTWAGMFSTLDGGSAAPCRNGAQWLNGGNGNFGCRFPESTVRNWNMAATYQLDSSLLGKKLQVMVEGKPTVTVTVNVKDVCSNSDCNGCCNRNTGNKKWKLIDIEKWPASALLGFNPTSSTFDINRDVKIPTAAGLRPGAPESDVMPLCYKILGSSDALI